MRKLALVPVMLLALTGCAPAATSADSSEESVAAAAPTVTPAGETPTPTPTGPERSVRGNLVKVVGQVFGLSSRKDSNVASADFVVNAITVNPECTGPHAEAPENGVFVRLDITGETTADLAPDNMFFTGWKVIKDDGTTFNGMPDSGAAYYCIPDTERLPNVVGPGEKVAGAVILDVPTEHGVLVLDQWEWVY